jgi:hypothetical protein
MKNSNLVAYAEKLIECGHADMGAAWRADRIEVLKLTCNTLWIPSNSSNRTAAINLNHGILGFDENDLLWGENGNCGTSYVIIEVPSWFNERSLRHLGARVCSKLCINNDGRVLRSDRLDVIVEALAEMSPTNAKVYAPYSDSWSVTSLRGLKYGAYKLQEIADVMKSVKNMKSKPAVVKAFMAKYGKPCTIVGGFFVYINKSGAINVVTNGPEGREVRMQLRNEFPQFADFIRLI